MMSGCEEGKRMARPPRFPVCFEFWGPEEHEAGFNALVAANGLLTKSDLMRMAFDVFLRQQGALAALRPVQPANSKHHQPAG